MEEYRNADLQLDVSGSGVHDEDIVRICVIGVGNREQAVGSGRLAFAGLPAEGEHEVVVDLLDGEREGRLGRAGPVSLGEASAWERVDWQPCEEDTCEACEAEGDRAADGEADWLLGVRFEEDT